MSSFLEKPVRSRPAWTQNHLFSLSADLLSHRSHYASQLSRAQLSSVQVGHDCFGFFFKIKGKKNQRTINQTFTARHLDGFQFRRGHILDNFQVD